MKGLYNTYFKQKGAFLELKKINGMYTRQKEINALFGYLYPNLEMYYFNFCKDGLMIYKLKNPNQYTFHRRFLPKDNTNIQEKEWKWVTELFNPIEIIYY